MRKELTDSLRSGAGLRIRSNSLKSRSTSCRSSCSEMSERERSGSRVEVTRSPSSSSKTR